MNAQNPTEEGPVWPGWDAGRRLAAPQPEHPCSGTSRKLQETFGAPLQRGGHLGPQGHHRQLDGLDRQCLPRRESHPQPQVLKGTTPLLQVPVRGGARGTGDEAQRFSTPCSGPTEGPVLLFLGKPAPG